MNYEEALSIIVSTIKEISCFKQPQSLYDPVTYLVSMKSKKIRSVFTLLAYSMFGECIKDAINVALSWEFFHNFTLIHDDIIDHAQLRRGNPTIHVKWDQTTAILSGDYLLILAYKYIVRSPIKYRDILLKLFSFTATQVCEGQSYDILFEKQENVSKEKYLKLIRLKTAELISACLYSGAILGEAKKNDAKFLQEMGIHLGMAFQIQDDLLDVYGRDNTFGKQIGEDIISNKKTYLLVSALNTFQKEKKKELLFWLNEKDKKQEKIKSIVALYNQIHLREKTCKVIADYYKKALGALEKIGVEKKKKAGLINLINNLSERIC